MPEMPEVLSATQSCHHSIAHVEKKTGRKVWGSPPLQIHYDPSSEERASNNDNNHFVEELTESLAPSVIRGSAKVNQTPIWPQIPATCPTLIDLQKSRSQRAPYQFMPKAELSRLTLQDVTCSPRTLIINFGIMLAQLQFLLHTSLQVYTTNQWDNLKRTPLSARKFCITVAFVFEHVTLAFLTRSHLFQVYWANSHSELPIRHISFTDDYDTFLQSVVEWIRGRRKSRCKCGTNLAMNVIRAASEIFGGVEKYLVQELFFLAGLSLALTEAELFDNASRVARFLMAYMQKIVENPSMWQHIVRPAMHGTVIAPMVKQRLAYGRHLRIWGKLQVAIPMRLAALVDAYERSRTYDTFEFDYIRDALKQPRHLGHLILPQAAWETLAGVPSTTFVDDPITAYFRQEDDTHLRVDAYAELFNPPFKLRSMSRRPTYTYDHNDAGCIWSLTSIDVGSVQSGNIRVLPELERQSRSFHWAVTHSIDVAVGPLEFCGNAIAVKSNGSTTHVLTGYGDPNALVLDRIKVRAVISNYCKQLRSRAEIKDKYGIPSVLPKDRKERKKMLAHLAKLIQSNRTQVAKNITKKLAVIAPSLSAPSLLVPSLSPSFDSSVTPSTISRPPLSTEIVNSPPKKKVVRKRKCADLYIQEGSGENSTPFDGGGKRRCVSRGLETNTKVHPDDVHLFYV